MPYLKDTRITKAWRHANEVDRIHYILEVDRKPRHLVVDKDTPGGLYAMLEAQLKSMGYTGPKSEIKENVK
jgi:hypothetical protein